MFAARGIAVSFSVFFLVYSGSSFAVAMIWRRPSPHSRSYPARYRADLLFALRMLPLGAALAVTAILAVPSFLILEPHAIQEPMGVVPIVLGLCGMMLLLFGSLNATAAALKASRTIATWVRDALRVNEECAVPVLRISRVVPALTAVGILRPRVLISDAAEFILNSNELQIALRHELAHVRRRDNLKKLLLHFTAFPRIGGLESAWLQATEMAADDAAVSSAADALDLAAALIKLSRLGPLPQAPAMGTALVQAPLAAVNARIERLIAWNGKENRPAFPFSPMPVVSVIVATAAVLVVTYSQLLVRIHTASEWLVR